MSLAQIARNNRLAALAVLEANNILGIRRQPERTRQFVPVVQKVVFRHVAAQSVEAYS